MYYTGSQLILILRVYFVMWIDVDFPETQIKFYLFIYLLVIKLSSTWGLWLIMSMPPFLSIDSNPICLFLSLAYLNIINDSSIRLTSFIYQLFSALIKQLSPQIPFKTSFSHLKPMSFCFDIPFNFLHHEQSF